MFIGRMIQLKVKPIKCRPDYQRLIRLGGGGGGLLEVDRPAKLSGD